MRACPKCYTLNADEANFCAECQCPMTATKSVAQGLSEWGERAAATRRYVAAHPPSSADLTEQQWYNVCKFWPNVARRCKREFANVGPDHPLDKTAILGPMLAGAKFAFQPKQREPGEEG